jgi:hypothetical protein
MKRTRRKSENMIKKNTPGSYEELKKSVEVNQEQYRKDLALIYRGMRRLEYFVKRLEQNI